jgi:hypothetical protein
VKIQTALLARYAEVEPQGGLLNVTGGGIDVFGVRRLPAEFTVALVLQLVFDESETGKEHELAVVVRGPDLQAVGERMAWPVTPVLGEMHAPGWRGFFSIAGAITIAVTAEGSHSIGLQLNGAEANDIPFQVLLAGI